MAEEPSEKYAIGFFDGQNLFRHAKEAFGHHHPNYDVKKLHDEVCAANGWKPTMVRFYTGVPTLERSELWSGYWSNRVLAMKRSGVAVVTRPLRYHREEVLMPDNSIQEIFTPHEKGIDVRLALDVVKLARSKQFTVAVVYSQDQDLSEVVAEIKEVAKEQDRWVKVVSAFPSGPLASSSRGIDGADWFKIDQAMYDGCLDSRDYRPRKFQ